MSTVTSDVSFSLSACLPDRNLCTPERAIVQPQDVGYHIILPANLEWGASVPNPSARTIEMTNAHGIVCWDLQARGSDGCSGPSGKGAPAGAGYVAQDAPPGALITSTRGGQTWFSVNSRGGAASKDNQGFYEFDVQFK